MTATTEIEDVLALTPLQEGLFSLARLADGTLDVYTMQFVVDIDGPLDEPALRGALAAVLARHPNLRASFWDQGVPRPVQIVPKQVPLPWERRDAVPPEDFDALAAAERRRPFDLSRGPALRVLLVTFSTGRRRLLVTAHHIVMDGWAVAVFFTELVAAYGAGGSTESLPPPRPFRDYIGWLAAQDTAAAAATWTEYLRGLPGPVMLADGAADTGDEPRRTRLTLASDDTARLTEWARTHDLTLNTVLQCAWAVVLSRFTDRRDVVFGTTVSGRPDSLAGAESMIGLFINAVPVRVRWDGGETLGALCRRVQRETARMREIGYLSLSTVQRAAGHGALFDTFVLFENAPIGSAIDPVHAPDGVRFRPVTMESLAHYPLTVVSYLADGLLVLMVEAVPRLFDPATAADIGARLAAVLRALPDQASATPDALEIPWTDAAADRCHTPALPDTPTASIPELFERQAAATPHAVALSSDHEQLSYAELQAAAAGLADELIARGVRPEDTVALLLPRSPRYVVAMLAVLRAGAAYVPVDPALPRGRMATMLSRCAPTLLLTVDALADSAAGLIDSSRVLRLDDAPGRRSGAGVPVRIRPDQRAYVIFTSGSTGEPKGVIGTHRALAHYFADHRERVYRPAVARLGRPLRIAHAWSFGFDASWQPLIGLLDGHHVRLFDEQAMRDAGRLVATIAAEELDMIDTSPTMYAQLRAAGLGAGPGPRLAVLALGGEAIVPERWRELRALPDTAVYNCYGPTETTVEAVVAAVTDSPAPTIGTPNAGSSAYVLDSRLRAGPPTAVGELYLGGAQLTRGYLADPGRTATRFVADPARPGERMYRTGDLVRRTPAGWLDYLGRGDAQVKIRGYRIEIGEIEAALLRHPDVRAAAVVTCPRPSGPSLVGCVVPRAERAPEPHGLRAHLTRELPGYMVPARILVRSSLPMTVNGKLDTAALVAAAGEQWDDHEPARTDTERALAGALAELLGLPSVSATADVFELGADSITVIALTSRARSAGIALAPRMVLRHSTIRALAHAVDTADAQQAEPADSRFGTFTPPPAAAAYLRSGSTRRLVQSQLLAVPAEVDRPTLTAVLRAVLDRHDMLRARVVRTTIDTVATAATDPARDVPLDAVDLAAAPEPAAALAAAARAAVERIDPETGAMVRAVWLTGAGSLHPSANLLLLVVHHAAVDVVSWHILLDDLNTAWRQLRAGQTAELAPPPTSYRRWSRATAARATDPAVPAQRAFWQAQTDGPDPLLGLRAPDPSVDRAAATRRHDIVTAAATTASLIADTGGNIGVRERLLAAVALAIGQWRTERGQDPAAGALVDLEGHGRADELFDDLDTSATLGWFTTIFPVRLGADCVATLAAAADPTPARRLIESVAGTLGAVPNQGFDYGLLPDPPSRRPQLMVNYLGRLDALGADGRPWTPVADPALHALLPDPPEPDLPLRYALELMTGVGPGPDGPRIMTGFRYSTAAFTAADIARLAEIWQAALDLIGKGH